MIIDSEKLPKISILVVDDIHRLAEYRTHKYGHSKCYDYLELYTPSSCSRAPCDCLDSGTLKACPINSEKIGNWRELVRKRLSPGHFDPDYGHISCEFVNESQGFLEELSEEGDDLPICALFSLHDDTNGDFLLKLIESVRSGLFTHVLFFSFAEMALHLHAMFCSSVANGIGPQNWCPQFLFVDDCKDNVRNLGRVISSMDIKAELVKLAHDEDTFHDQVVDLGVGSNMVAKVQGKWLSWSLTSRLMCDYGFQTTITVNGSCRHDESKDEYIYLASDVRMESLNVILKKWEFDANSLTDEQLRCAAYLMLREFAIDLDVDDKRLRLAISRLQRNYLKENPYHNFKHAVDVLQCVYFLVFGDSNQQSSLENNRKRSKTSSGWNLKQILDSVDLFAIAVAALGHDMGHPGLTNSFLVEQEAPVAIIYNNQSVLENMHCASLFSLLRYPETNFAHSWSKSTWTKFRNTVIAAILGTDMSRHAEYVRDMTSLFASKFDDENVVLVDSERRTLAIAVIKFADICNVIRPFSIARRWGFHLITEFFEQGDWEAALGQECLSPLTRRTADTSALAAGQIYFYSEIARPMFQLLAVHVCEMAFAVSLLDKNLEHWKTWTFEDDQLLQDSFANLVPSGSSQL